MASDAKMTDSSFNEPERGSPQPISSADDATVAKFSQADAPPSAALTGYVAGGSEPPSA